VTRRLTALALLVLLLAGGVPAVHADDDDDRGQRRGEARDDGKHGRDDDRGRRRGDDERGRDNDRDRGSSRISLDQAVQMVQQRFDARVVRAESRSEGGRTVYHLRLLNSEGRVWTVRVDAQTGSVK
jgi:uncharacterized membrane protein YkoI